MIKQLDLANENSPAGMCVCKETAERLNQSLVTGDGL